MVPCPGRPSCSVTSSPRTRCPCAARGRRCRRRCGRSSAGRWRATRSGASRPPAPCARPWRGAPTASRPGRRKPPPRYPCPPGTCPSARPPPRSPPALSLGLHVRRPVSLPDVPHALEAVPEPRPDVVLHVALDEASAGARLALHLDAPEAGARRRRLDPLPLGRRDLAALRQLALD